MNSTKDKPTVCRQMSNTTEKEELMSLGIPKKNTFIEEIKSPMLILDSGDRVWELAAFEI